MQALWWWSCLPSLGPSFQLLSLILIFYLYNYNVEKFLKSSFIEIVKNNIYLYVAQFFLYWKYTVLEFISQIQF